MATKEEWIKEIKEWELFEIDFDENERKIIFIWNKEKKYFKFKHIIEIDINPKEFMFSFVDILIKEGFKNIDLYKIKQKINSLSQENQTHILNLNTKLQILKQRIINIDSAEFLFFINRNKIDFYWIAINYERKKWVYNYLFFKIGSTSEILAIIKELIKIDFLIQEELTANDRIRCFAYRYNHFNKKGLFVPKQIFLISEFNDENDIINNRIKVNMGKMGFNVIIMNIDHEFGNINLAIKKYIKESEWILVNLSHENEWNPNVFYEIGLSHAYEKNVIMFLKESQFPNKYKNQNLPFDISSHTCIKKDDDLINKIISIVK